MAYRRLAELTYRLYRKTLEGKIDWEVTASVDVYQASLASHSILISVQPSQTAAGEDVKIVIVDGEGNIVETFLDVDLDVSWFSEMGAELGPYTLMLDLYNQARRFALGSEKSIQDILNELDD